MRTSYLRAFLEAIKSDLYNLYQDDGQTIEWDGYGDTYPQNGNVSGAIALSPRQLNVKGDLSGYPLSKKSVYLAQIEVKLTGNQGFDDLALIYDHHEFILEHLLREVRIIGLTGTFEGVPINQACLGLEIIRQDAGIAAYQDNLVRLRSLISFEWEYLV